VIVERDSYGAYHVRGTAGDGQEGWQIQVWLLSSDQDGVEDHEIETTILREHRSFRSSFDEFAVEIDRRLTVIEKKLNGDVATPRHLAARFDACDCHSSSEQ
jgi:hypothetical protein